MEEYGIMEYLELIVAGCGQWTNFFGVALSSLHLFQQDFDRWTYNISGVQILRIIASYFVPPHQYAVCYFQFRLTSIIACMSVV